MPFGDVDKSPPIEVRRQWPKLSETLLGARHPTKCQSCGLSCSEDDRTLTRWIECDEYDRPTSTIIVLCRTCSDRIIEPHPRLYRDVERFKPVPGCMALCVSCRFREQLRCTHPDLKANGGQGLRIKFAPPSTAFFDGTRGGRRTGWTGVIYDHAPSACIGRVE